MKFILLMMAMALMLSNSVISCEIKSFENIYFISANKITAREIISNSDCSQLTQNNFLAQIKLLNGKIPGHLLKEKIITNNEQVNLSPEFINIRNLAEVIKESIDTAEESSIDNIKMLNGKNVISLSSNDTIEISCNNCSTFGNKTFRIKTSSSNENGGPHEFWVNADLLSNSKVLVAKDDITSFGGQEFSNSVLEEVRPIDNPSIYFKKRDELKFFELIRPLQKGSLIKMTDLRPKQLIKSGEKVKVIIRSNDLHITGVGLAKKNSYWGEQIEVFNPNNSKKITGRVIDYNTILTEL